jgi:hypothetical protein
MALVLLVPNSSIYTYMHGISVLIKRASESCLVFSTLGGHRDKEGGHMNQKQALIRPQICWFLDLEIKINPLYDYKGFFDCIAFYLPIYPTFCCSTLGIHVFLARWAMNFIKSG